MQPSLAQGADYDQTERETICERVIMEVRRLWFDARDENLGCATAVIEQGGELVMMVRAEPFEADRLIADAARRNAYFVVTNASRPTDLSGRLRREGYRSVQRHGAYVFDPPAVSQPRQQPRSLLSLLGLRDPLSISVQTIGEAELPIWNDICWRAFGPRGRRDTALAEKQRAFRSMGARARWYLAWAGDRPVGTACLFQSDQAAQVLAVGTIPGYRGRGVASAVISQAIEDWRAAGRGLLFLDTLPDGPAERLYMGLGFRPTYTRELWAPMPILG